MIYFLNGNIVKKLDKKSETERGQYLVLQAGEFIALKIGVPKKIFEKSKINDPVKLYTYLAMRENAMDLYGFENEEELTMFELLNGISGIGPKSALSILSVAEIETLKAAILSGKSNLLTRASGIGPKTAGRIILELKNKIQVSDSVSQRTAEIESDLDLIEVLAEIGYSKQQAKESVSKIPGEIIEFEKRLKEALRLLSRK